MGKPWIQASALAMIALCLSSCISTKVNDVAHKALKFTKKDTIQQPDKPALPSTQSLQIPIGTVHMVDQVGRFILIKSSRATALEPDVQIVSYGPDARMSSQLKSSQARKGAYLTADLIEGIPKVGDIVMVVKSMTFNNNSSKPAGVTGMESGNVQVLE